MFTIAIWNSGKGLAINKSPTPTQKAKKSFVEYLKEGFNTDVVILSEFCKYGRNPTDLGFEDHKFKGQTYVGLTKGKFDRVCLGPDHSSYVEFDYISDTEGKIKFLAVYANGESLAQSQIRFGKTLDDLAPRLQGSKTVIAGDLNIWQNLKGRNGTRSKEILGTIEKMGLKSAFHNDPGFPEHLKLTERGSHNDLDLTTFEDKNGQTYIDYIMFSRGLEVFPKTSRIVRTENVENNRHIMRRGHSAVVVSLTSVGN